ncbi:RTA1-domain-containing protein [Massarina eburnea CBS 473.64]|uniref:RTA1-domain-containing protein n=1 Tax=Massarina eburnea CBS 473.64 TaxID=1395130 RepID=A0A6A6RTQ0_9PLEO|nr:RTA1-domain-containing protein [Massarina eburnea CBS 473.64]
MDFALPLLVRALDENGIDPDHLILNTTDPILISMQKKYCKVDLCPMEWAILQYRPNLIGNIIYLTLFGVLLASQLFFGIRKKTYKYCATVCLGIIGEMVGYVGRLMVNKNPFPMDNFLINLVPLTVSPALLTGAIYLCLGRVIIAIGAENSRIRPKWYTYIFIGSDLLSLVLQAVGGAIASTADDKKGSDVGVKIMIAGLVFQVASMTAFFTIWGDFVLSVKKAGKKGTLARSQPPLYRGLRDSGILKWFQLSLFIATVLIFVRCIYRVAELWGGFDSHLANHELTFMIFEGPMIIGAVSAMTVMHPGRVFDKLWDAAGKGIREMKLEDSESYLLSTEYSHV